MMLPEKMITDDEFESYIKFFSQPSIGVFKDYGEKIAMTDKAKKMMRDFVDDEEKVKKKIFKKLEKITIEIDDEIMNRIGTTVITEMFIERLKLKKEMEKNKIRKDIFEIMVGEMLGNSSRHQAIKEKISQYIG